MLLVLKQSGLLIERHWEMEIGDVQLKGLCDCQKIIYQIITQSTYGILCYQTKKKL